jgi:hypothetical protein
VYGEGGGGLCYLRARKTKVAQAEINGLALPQWSEICCHPRYARMCRHSCWRVWSIIFINGSSLRALRVRIESAH